ncbi:hypothetical protein HanXRQr2_Chr17g0813911 [Helianthus annuus]|uniref:Uncharacterized protein n=1 Tax=Helianthus annuus TaxID=4232 RepID=A0A9K3DJ66_HELAN|nr:hypothetical protein HanXRQr2_Chr17g0813911 [Helianthus annuus]
MHAFPSFPSKHAWYLSRKRRAFIAIEMKTYINGTLHEHERQVSYVNVMTNPRTIVGASDDRRNVVI